MTLTREGIAYRVARDFVEGSYINLGVGIPSLIPAYLPPDREIFIHNENGVLGVGPLAAPGAEDPDLVSANKEYITLLPGASVFDHAISFSMIRGGHLTHAVMGAMEVAANGDMANWRVPGQKVPGVGGAMDLAFGVQNVWIAMTHVTNKGEPKILTKCNCPLTAPRCVRRIYTDLAVIDVTSEGLMLCEVARGLDAAAVQAKTGAPLRVANDCREMDVPAAFKGVPLSN
ncbi:MAG: 3-oxoacid CoA-transferase subunit B [Betaproteobacteria bacterium]|nr:3-oxoacid CoA-transferase subunit B [Betaproteobacteria bacterium]